MSCRVPLARAVILGRVPPLSIGAGPAPAACAAGTPCRNWRRVAEARCHGPLPRKARHIRFFSGLPRAAVTSPKARALAALGHDVRLSIFRLLAKAGADGLRISDIGAHPGLAPSTLARHLSALVDAGPVTQAKQGREVVNRVDFATMKGLASFLTSECCTGVALAPTGTAA